MAPPSILSRRRTAPPAEGVVDTSPRGWAIVVVGGLVAGAVAGMAMAMWTMVAGATFRDTGFFTPMYLIAAAFAGTDGPAAPAAARGRAGDRHGIRGSR